jgi:TonB family protein
MRAAVLYLVAAVGSLALGAEPVSKNEIGALDLRLREVGMTLASSPGNRPDPDFRGRQEIDDLRQWAFQKETLEKLHALRKIAASSDSEAARRALEEATALLDASIARANSIEIYWGTGTAPYWRRDWNAFATANALPASDAQQTLLALEADISKLLESGEFERAANEATPPLDREQHALMSRAQNEIVKATASASLVFRRRATPCPEEVVRGVEPDSNAKLTRGAPLQTFYPPSSIVHQQQGDIVLRTHVDTTGCATDVAIVVHSGYPDLDAAALRWFETARFLPQQVDGKAVEKELTFKVRFKLRDEKAG